MKTIKKVSVHGGHSKEFCLHAEDLLEDIIKKYIKEGFAWVGITEHCPPISDDLRYPDEKNANISADQFKKQFKDYILKINKLKKKYSSKIKIFIGFETEAYDGYINYTKKLIQAYKPDYIVGSVHHIHDICFDFSKKLYNKAIKASGSIDLMYENYFDKQYELITHLKPAVVGHFDLIRIFDPEYAKQIKRKKTWKKIVRNLKACKDNDLILDFNTRALKKNASEPYISKQILQKARELDVKVVPGDDSHGTMDIGTDIKTGIELLDKEGFNTDWPEPKIYANN
ncbi:MAG: histidinol-phosphatase HisJ [Desulfobacteraceae bacterium]|nr:histidinol-phosphatase HisJ [Desulfobacteraceae bacterium]